MDSTFDLGTKPLARALISYAVKWADPTTEGGIAREPQTHLVLLQTGVTRTVSVITDTVLLLLGRSSLSSSEVLPEDAPVIIGFSLLIMIGITQALNDEGIALNTNELAERLIARHLAQRIRAAGSDEAAQREILEVSRAATLIPGQIVASAQGEVEELFKRCYSALPAFILGTDETRKQLMPMFGTALLLLLQSRIKTND